VADADQIHLTGKDMSLTINRRTGAIAELRSTQTGWRAQDRPELGRGFRLLIPLPGRRNNLAHAEQQPPPRIDQAAESEVQLSWPQVRSEHGGTHPIAVTQRISLRDQQVVVETTIDNRSGHVVENVWAPCLGDLRPPAPGEELHSFCYAYGSASRLRMWPEFDNTCGYWGVDHPTQFGRGPNIATLPVSPFLLVLAREQGLYLGVTEPRYDLVSWHAELVPGYGDAMHARVAEDATIRLSAVHVPFVPPGETRTLTPVALQLFQGDWHAGADIYRQWRDTWMSRSATPAWVAEPHSWLQLHINSPEDELRVPFRDLPEVGRECAAAGVRAIQLVGWNEGGQDRGNPSHRPDPRLGTFEELRDAIAQIQALGVQVVLFCKFVWADRSTDRYRSLAADTIKDPYGDTYNGSGYRYQTGTQLLGVNVRHLIPMCFGSEHYLDVCQQEFDTIVRLGANGMLFDECQHHADAILCFDTTHGHRAPWPVYAGDNELARRFHEQTRHSPEFLYSGEGIYDWEFEQYHLSYFRSANTGHIPLNRYLLPDAPLMTAATGFDDRNIVNQCLLYRYLISYEPFNFKGRIPDFTKTVTYGQRMDALRTELREWFWDGTFRDTVGAQVRSPDGTPHHPYAVYLHRDTGEPALAIANYEDEQVTVEIDGIGTPLTYRLADDGQWHQADGRIDLPARSAAVVLPASASPSQTTE
jgi:hypothetical protein